MYRNLQDWYNSSDLGSLSCANHFEHRIGAIVDFYTIYLIILKLVFILSEFLRLSEAILHRLNRDVLHFNVPV